MDDPGAVLEDLSIELASTFVADDAEAPPKSAGPSPAAPVARRGGKP